MCRYSLDVAAFSPRPAQGPSNAISAVSRFAAYQNGVGSVCDGAVRVLGVFRPVRAWRLPVGHDRDGAVANAYAVAICPVVTLAARGGEVRRTLFGSQDAVRQMARTFVHGLFWPLVAILAITAIQALIEYSRNKRA